MFVMFVIFGLLMCLGCGEPSLPESEFLSVRPRFKVPLVFKFKNQASRTLSEYSLETVSGSEKEADKATQIWSSSASGQLDLSWSGELLDEDSGLILGMDYGLSHLHWAERDQWEERAWSWSQEIGGDPVVSMKRGGLSRSNPMGLMRGDPRDYFLAKRSQAFFWLDGEPFLKNGQLHPAKTLDGPKNTAAIGQYFLSGLPVAEWAHRLLLALPKTKELKDGLRWKKPFHRWYNVPPKALSVNEWWTCRQTDLGWRFEMSLVDRQGRVAGKNMDRPMSYWVFHRKVTAILSREDFMPLWLKWEESGEWVDQLPPLGGSAKPISAKRHQWTNSFEADRT
jgi:hypothetical protein